MRSNFEQKVGELLTIEYLNLWLSFQDSILKVSDEYVAKK